MYRVILDDNYILLDPRLPDMTIISGSVSLAFGEAGSAKMVLPANHPSLSFIKRIVSVAKVYRDDKLIFCGRVLDTEADIRGNTTVRCEGELAYFLDTLQRPWDYSGTLQGLIAQFVASHNAVAGDAKQFTLGAVTVTDSNDYVSYSNSKYESTKKNIDDHLVKTHGGYLQVRYSSDGTRYLDWLADSTTMSDQTITLSGNLTDYTKKSDSSAIATALVPLGATTSETVDGQTVESTVDIASVNNDVDYIYDADAVALYGWIWATETWDDVTEPANLLTKAQARLAELVQSSFTLELSAVGSFLCGQYVKVTSKFHEIDDFMLIKKQDVDLVNDAKNTITVGLTRTGLIDTQSKRTKTLQDYVEQQDRMIRNYTANEITRTEAGIASAIQQATMTLQSLIQQTSESIMSEVSTQYATQDDVTSLISTKITQLSDSVNILFTNLQTTVDSNDADAQTQFQTISKYIRFVDGDIVLGEEGNTITLRIENDRLSFLDGGAEVAYFSNKKLVVLDANFLNSLQIGSFAFIPRKNGNLSLIKVDN